MCVVETEDLIFGIIFADKNVYIFMDIFVRYIIRVIF